MELPTGAILAHAETVLTPTGAYLAPTSTVLAPTSAASAALVPTGLAPVPAISRTKAEGRPFGRVN